MMFQLACPGIANRMTSPLINQLLSWAFLKSPEFKAQQLVTYSSRNCHLPFLLHSSPISCSHTCSVAVLLSQPSIYPQGKWSHGIVWSPYLSCSSSSLIKCWPTPILTEAEMQRTKKQIFPILLQRAGLPQSPSNLSECPSKTRA